MAITHDEIHHGHNSHSIPGLIRELRDEGIVLFRQEIELAKTEMSEKASRVVRNSAYVGAGTAVVYAGFLFVLAAITGALTIIFSAADLGEWSAPLAAVIVGVVAGIVGGIVAYEGRAAVRRESLIPEQTVESLKEDRRWAERKVRQG